MIETPPLFNLIPILIFVLAGSAVACDRGGTTTAAGGAHEGAELEPTRTGPPRVTIAVTAKGFEPPDLEVTRGEQVTLVFERTTDQTCAKEVVVHLAEGQVIERALPLNQPVEVSATFATTGDLVFACGMDMVKGHLHVR